MFKFKYLTLHGVLGDVFQYLYFFFGGGDEKEQFDLRPFSVSVELEVCFL